MQVLEEENSNILELIRERIIYIADNHEVSRKAFLEKTGLKKGVFDYKDIGRAVGSDKLSNILDCYPDLNTEWLLTGKGEMISDLKEETKVFTLRTDNNVKDQSIPLYNLEATAGIVSLFNDSNSTEPIDYLTIPNLPKCDGAIFVTGDSMYPLLKSGDIVAYKQINDFQNELFWGEMYLISIEVAGDHYTMVKYVQKSDEGKEYIKLVSQNSHHQPKDIHLSKVKAMAVVKASVRYNFMK